MSLHDINHASPSHPVTPAVPQPAPQPPTETMRTSIFLPPMFQQMDQGPQVPSALTAAPTAATLARAFQRRWPIAVAAGLILGALAGFGVFFLMPPKFMTFYRAKVSATQQSGPMRDGAADGEFAVYKATQAAIAKKRSVITRALEMQGRDGRYVKDLGIIRDKLAASIDPVEWLQAAIKTDFNQAPEIMTVTLSADNGEELTMLLNALAKSFIEENKIDLKRKHDEQIETAEADVVQAAKELELKRRTLTERIKALGGQLGDRGRRLDQLEQELAQTRKLMGDKQDAIAGVRTRLDQLSKPREGPVPEAFISDALSREPEALPYLKKVADTTKEYNDALRILGDPRHPQMIRYQHAKEAAAKDYDGFRRLRLPELTRKYREKEAADNEVAKRQFEIELATLEEQERILSGRAANLNVEIQGVRPHNLPAELTGMEKNIEALEKAQSAAVEKLQMYRLQKPPLRVEIHADAIEPNAKDTSKQMKIAGAGSIAMFLVGVLGVCFLEFRSRKITCSEEVKRGLGLTVIGTVPTLPEKARTPIAQTKLEPYWQNQLMESIDTIRTMLLHSARSNNTRVIMVTSAVGGEGKTSLASQLAASMARAWKKTLLIDGDLRNPTSHKLFDVPQEPGLSEVLRGELPASEAVRSTPLSRLWVLPAGHWDSHAVQALAQDNVRTILEELKLQYDFIILDSCPILPVADSLLLGQNVDSVILAVMRDFSRSPAVYAAHQRLESLGIKTLGAVVIGAKNELGPMGYKYAYQPRPQQ